MKINFNGECCVPESTRQGYAVHNRTLGIPYVEDVPLHDRPLAIVGGGPSIIGHVDELKAWKGDIWAVNGAFRWCKAWGIRTVYFTLDPLAVVGDMELDPDEEAILAGWVDPKAIQKLSHARLRLYHLDESNSFGPSSATMSLVLAPKCGYRKIVYFGCESSFREEKHAYPNDADYPGDLVVECGGRRFMTAPTLYMQAQLISEMIRRAPHIFSERSGGLMGAMVEHGDHDVIAGSRGIAHQVIKEEYHGGLCPFEIPLEELA